MATVAMHAACWAPALSLVSDRWTTPMINPGAEMTTRTGSPALILLLLGLACTPARRWFGLGRLGRWRRWLGLYAYFYAALHLWVFVGFEYRLDVGLIWEDSSDKAYVYFGLASFLLLTPLAVTSTGGWIRRLGRRWARLHSLVYAAALLAVLHYYLLVKSDLTWPLLYGAILAVLLLLRMPWLLRRRGRGQPLLTPGSPAGAATAPDR